MNSVLDLQDWRRLYYMPPSEHHSECLRYSELMDVEEEADLIPGLDFRRPEYRRETFLRFYGYHLKYGSHPGVVYALIPWLGKQLHWSLEDALWFAFINGCTQHPVTSYVIMRRFPDSMWLDHDLLDAWFNDNFTRLGWDTDRRHQKAQFPACIRCYCDLLAGRSQETFFMEECGGGGEHDFFRRCWKLVRDQFHTFGRLSTFSYLEYLRICGLPLNCDQLFLDDMSGSKSHRNGIAKVLGRDDLDWYAEAGFKGQYTFRQIEWLAEEAATLLNEAQWRTRNEPWARHVNYFTLESAFCTYKSWHRPNRRYPNVYVDMLYNRIKSMQERWPDEGLELFWLARSELFPDYLLLEQQPDDVGLRPEKQNWYRNTGEVICMGRDDPVFVNGYEATHWR
jgi:hypothetical protein